MLVWFNFFLKIFFFYFPRVQSSPLGLSVNESIASLSRQDEEVLHHELSYPDSAKHSLQKFSLHYL